MIKLIEKGVPEKPNGPLQITNVQSNGCTLLWAPPREDGGSRVTAYKIEAREAKRATWYEVDVVEVSENQYVVKDLIENNSYYFRVSAKNAVGISEPLESDTCVSIKRPPGAPDTPVPLLVTDIESDGCTLEWKAPAWTGGEDLKGYLIESRIGDKGEWKKVSDIEAGQTRYKVKNLKEGQEYYFRISSYNSKGSSKPLELNRPVVPKKKLTTPSIPTGPISVLTTKKDSITIQWGPPKNNGGAPIIRYIVYYREVNKPNWLRATTCSSETFSCQVANLTENADYHFKIVAENHVGASEGLQTQEPIKARSQYNVPDRPEGPLVISNVTDRSATVAWKKPLNDGGSPITGYLVKRRDVNRPVWVKCGRVSADTFSVNVRDLLEGCQYVVQVFAENSEGLSAPLDSDEYIQPKRVVGPPEPPTNFECIGVDATEVTLQWEDSIIEGGLPIKSYKLEICEKGKKATGGEGRQWRVVKDDIPAINSSYTVRNLKEGHEYLFRISATNEKGTGEPKVLDKPAKPAKMIVPPSQPVGPLKVTPLEDNCLMVNWSESKNDGGSTISNYVIEVRDALKANWSQVATVNAFTSSYKISGLSENVDYFVRVKAQNEANLTSQPLETDVSVTVKSPYSVPDAPRDIKVTPLGKDKVCVEFKASLNDGGSGIKNYTVEKRDANRVTWIKAGRVKTDLDDATQDHVYKFEVEELVPGASYYFRVIAENQEGRSEACETSATIRMEKEVEKPSKPLDLNVIKQKKPNSVLLDWKAPLYDGNEKLKEYVLEQWSSDTRQWKIIATCAPTETSYQVNDLKEGLSYRFRIRASNKAGQGDASLETVDVKVQKNISVPEQPIGPLKYTISEDNTTINLEWSAPTRDGGSKIKRYVVEKRMFGMGLSSEWFKVGFTGPTDTSFKVVEYQTQDVRFSFRIVAENEAGKSQPLELSEPISIERKIRVPEKPSYLRVKDKTVDSVTLVWRSFAYDSFSEADKFFVEKRRKETSAEWTRVGHTRVETYTITDLEPNSVYFFRVIAANTAGESEPSEILEPVSTDISDELPSKPISISIDDVTQDSVTLSWISSKNSGSKPIIGYKIYKLASNEATWHEVGQIPKSKKLSYTISELNYKYEYRFRICAYSEIGCGKYNETEKVELKKPIG